MIVMELEDEIEVLKKLINAQKDYIYFINCFDDEEQEKILLDKIFEIEKELHGK